MTLRIHPLASVTATAKPDDVHRWLRAHPQELAAAATADALSSCGPVLRSVGLRPTAVPTVTTDAGGELGSLTIRWRGADERTGWPAMTAYLAVTPAGSGSLLTLYSSRFPGPELRTSTLHAVHRGRLARILVGAFLQALVQQRQTVPTVQPELTGAGR